MDLSDIKIESIVISPKKSKESIKQRCIRLNAIYDDKISKRRIEGKEKIYDNNDEFDTFFNVINVEDLLKRLCYKSHDTTIKKTRQFGRKSKKVSKIFQSKHIKFNCEDQCNGLFCNKSFMINTEGKQKVLLSYPDTIDKNTSSYTRKKYIRKINYVCNNFKNVNGKINKLISKYPVKMLKIYGDDLLEYLYIRCFSEIIDLFNNDIECYGMNYKDKNTFICESCNNEFNNKFKHTIVNEKDIENKINICDRCKLLLDKK